MSEKTEILKAIEKYFDDNSTARDLFWEQRTEELNAVLDKMKGIVDDHKALKDDHKIIADAIGNVEDFKLNIKALNAFLVGATSIIRLGKVIGAVSLFFIAIWNFFIKEKTEK